MTTKDKVSEAFIDVELILAATDWNMPMPEPSLYITMIEAKAKLMEANKKLNQVLEALNETDSKKLPGA